MGGGVKSADQVRKLQKDLTPKGVEWFKTKASSFDPENNSVTLADGKKVF